MFVETISAPRASNHHYDSADDMKLAGYALERGTSAC